MNINKNVSYKVVENEDIKKIKPYDNNSRKHPEEQIMKLMERIKEFGFNSVLSVNGDGIILAGHGRYEAAKRLGLKAVPVRYVYGLSAEQEKAFRISDNASSDESDWDYELLKIEMDALVESDYDNMELLGINDDIFSDYEKEQRSKKYGDKDPDAAPEADTKAKSQIGDVWLLGKHRVVCGDSTNKEHIQLLCEGETVHLLVTDPPYNVDYTGGTSKKLKIKNDKMENSSFRRFLRDALTNADSIMRKGAAYYIWHADSEGYNFRGACQDVEWKVRQCLIWRKNQLVMGRQDYHWQHEPCLYGWKDGASHTWETDRKQTTILEYDKPARNDVHPTMKPVELIEYLIGNSSRVTEIVLDLFGGSGTTLIAAEKLNRVCYMVEFDPIYVDVIIKRWQDFTGEDAVNEKTSKTYNDSDYATG